MASMTFGRSSLRSRSSSALSASYPFFVIGVGMPSSSFPSSGSGAGRRMVLLQRANDRSAPLHRADAHHRRSSSPHGGEVRDTVVQRFAPNRGGVRLRGATSHGIDDQTDGPIFNMVHEVRASFLDFVHGG